MKLALAVCLVLASTTSWAALYKCEVDGKVSYQDRPCLRPVAPQPQQPAPEDMSSSAPALSAPESKPESKLVTAPAASDTAPSAADANGTGAVHGGSGGNAFTSDCGADGIMAAVKTQSGTVVDSVQAVCTKVLTDGKWTGATFEALKSGGAGGTPASLNCSEGFAVKGISGSTGTLVDQISFHCGKLGASGGAVGIVAGDEVTLGPVGGSGGTPFAQDACPDGQVARGLKGRHGELIDQIELICHYPTAQPPPLASVPVTSFLVKIAETEIAIPALAGLVAVERSHAQIWKTLEAPFKLGEQLLAILVDENDYAGFLKTTDAHRFVIVTTTGAVKDQSQTLAGFTKLLNPARMPPAADGSDYDRIVAGLKPAQNVTVNTFSVNEYHNAFMFLAPTAQGTTNVISVNLHLAKHKVLQYMVIAKYRAPTDVNWAEVTSRALADGIMVANPLPAGSAASVADPTVLERITGGTGNRLRTSDIVVALGGSRLLLAIVMALLYASAVWVYVDASGHKIGKIQGAGGLFNLSAGAWGAVSMGIWIVGFPAYMSKRSTLIERAKLQPVESRGRWLKAGILCIVGTLLTIYL